MFENMLLQKYSEERTSFWEISISLFVAFQLILNSFQFIIRKIKKNIKFKNIFSDGYGECESGR